MKVPPGDRGIRSVHVHRSGPAGTWTFELPTVPQAAFMVSVVEEMSDEPVWWLVSDAFTDVLPLYAVRPEGQAASVEDTAAFSEQLISRGVAPTELESARAFHRPLKSLVYGEVPRGFRQALPPGRPQAPLAAGRSYTINVLGGAGVVIARATFIA